MLIKQGDDGIGKGAGLTAESQHSPVIGFDDVITPKPDDPGDGLSVEEQKHGCESNGRRELVVRVRCQESGEELKPISHQMTSALLYLT